MLAMATVTAWPPSEPSTLQGTMTGRQIETLKLAMQGKPNKVIAREMSISEATVKAHLATAFRVLGVRNRTEAVFAAARHGLTA
jgi:DNA-binding NarL/FixJ family response regulator